MLKSLAAAVAAVSAALVPLRSARAQEPAPPPPPAAAPEAAPAVPADAASPLRFAPEIAHFAELDATAPPPACNFLFVGSSSIRFWRSLETDMAPWPVVNRGFGGSRIADVDYYFDQVVAPYRPRAIFFYAGENDLWAGEGVDAVVADFQRFLDLKTEKLGDTQVYFISLKPSRQRLNQIAQQAEVNARIKALADQRPDLDYVDVVPTMLEQGAPKDIFVADGLHMTPDGYGLWTGVVRPVLEREAHIGRACPGPTITAARP
ncbi:MAG TPA: GDSL-type esterase/lipase family protein [Phenylobacterium sp.]|nr:GDSL-type esterase/lipase family protein [Phenylobacterium sp.]